jgi:hypothetical protein
MKAKCHLYRKLLIAHCRSHINQFFLELVLGIYEDDFCLSFYDLLIVFGGTLYIGVSVQKVLEVPASSPWLLSHPLDTQKRKSFCFGDHLGSCQEKKMEKDNSGF